MKKILLGTSGLFGAVALFAGAAAAQTPTVTVGGFLDFQAGFIDDDVANSRSNAFRNDSEVSIRVDGKSDSGLGYGAVLDIEADVSADSDDEGINASRTYLFLDSGVGRLELGSNTGAAEAMRIDASSIARATGGIDGSWTYFANQPQDPANNLTLQNGATAAGVPFISVPSLPAGHGLTEGLGNESTDNANKISYYSPRLSGFQLGLSYAPELNDRGQGIISNSNNSVASDVIDIALSYEGSWDQVSLGLSGAYQTAQGSGVASNAVFSNGEDIDAYNVGASLGFAGFSLAGSYGDWGDVTANQGAGAASVDADYWTVGAGFDIGAVGASVTYLESSLGTNDFENLVLGADYSLAAGLTPYVEASFFEFEGVDSTGAAANNDGTAVIIGTQLAF